MHYGAQLHREGTKLAKGHIYALMGHLALHIIGPLATTEQGNCPAILALHISVFIGTVEPGKLSQWIIIFGPNGAVLWRIYKVVKSWMKGHIHT